MTSVVGIDVGGTFTDLYFMDEANGTDLVLKVPSTPQDPSRGVVDALAEAGLDPKKLDAILHGTTIATNAVIERRGASTALVTTKGFRDVLELGRRDRQRVYGLTGEHRPLVPRARRWEVTERTDHRGQIIVPLDEEEVRGVAAALLEDDVDAVVVSFLHSYANSGHEERVAEILREANPAWQVVTSSSVVREYFEFERTSTAVVQGYLQPLVAAYANNLQKRLREAAFEQRPLIMQSNGGLVPLSQLKDRAANIVRSGPAAGVTAAAQIAAQAGYDRIITGDMGGTSYDVAVVIDGQPRIADTTDLDFRIPLRIPMIDVHTIGAGGGSIAYLDRSGILQVGPRSAGAVPGPVCFGRGGTEPTVADANAVLGRINPDHPIGLKHLDALDVDAARAAIARLGEPLGLDVEQTANAILTLVNHRMAGRTRLLTVERGYDPRDFALVVFGGAGPLHGAAIMREVGVRTMLIPPNPGVLCAQGCASADLRYDMSQTIEAPLDEVPIETITGMLADQKARGEEQVASSAVQVHSVETLHAAEMSYVGQIHSLRIEIGLDWGKDQLLAAFREAYRRQYGNELPGIAVSLVSLRTSVHGIRAKAKNIPSAEAAHAPPPAALRCVYFDRYHDTPIYDRSTLVPGSRFAGPAIVEQGDTTTVIEPGMAVRVDPFNNLIVELA
ncbi:hydantoinase/oxoprolinase family protein [Sphingobium sp. TomTYG45]